MMIDLMDWICTPRIVFEIRRIRKGWQLDLVLVSCMDVGIAIESGVVKHATMKPTSEAHL
jgi:hypothetical protein